MGMLEIPSRSPIFPCRFPMEGAPMPIPVVLAGLVQAAQKRRLLGRVPSQRLIEHTMGRGVTDLPALHAWLASGDGLSRDLAKKLLDLLPPPEGRRFGPYEALAHLADGGMGSVWLAHREGSEDLVVVKTMKASVTQGAEVSKGTELLRRFERETSITRQLSHPNVVRCLDAGVADAQTTFMVLEYVDSGDLRDLVDAKGGLSEGLALAILYQVVDGLAEAHRLKLIHRDIKPPNIFVSSNGRAKLADFGIARSTEANRTMLTMAGAIVGSPQYMSPEQIVTDPGLDIRSDIYALGGVLYFCLTAEPPYTGRLQEILHQHCTAPIPDARRKRAKLSDGTLGIITKAMAKDRAQRYQDPTAMREAILAAMKGLGMQPGAASEESTALKDFSAVPGHGAHRDIATLTADLRRQAGLDDIATITDPQFLAAGAATVTVDGMDQPEQPTSPSQELPTMAADLSSGDPVAHHDLPTIASDLSGSPFCDPGAVTVGSGKYPVVAPGSEDMATMTASLLAQEMATAPGPSVQQQQEPGTSATVVEEMGTIARILSGKEPATGATGEPFLGDPTQALAADWIALVPASAQANDPTVVVLYARTRILLGKLKEAPVDLCLRNYPVALHKEACQRISRSHLVVRYDPIQNTCQIEDQQAANGTLLDGIAVPPGGTVPLASGVDNIIDLAGVITLWARCLPRQGGKVRTLHGLQGPPGTSGLDTDHGFDAITLTRPGNRPEMSYALVLRRLSIGGPGSDLPLAGARTRTAVEVARFADRWIWRPAAQPGSGAGPWQPLLEGATLDCGGRPLVVRRADIGVF